jgi:tyrosine-protein phosphatase SIW14
MTHLSPATRAVSLLMIILFCVSAQQASENRSHPANAAKRKTIVGLGNFAEVTPKLYRGGQPQEPGFQALKKMGVDIVVDLRLSAADRERKEVNKLGMQFLPIPWHCDFPKDQVFARFLTVLRDNPGKKVFVHCRYGDDRTGMVIAAYRMAIEGWSAEEAQKEMQEFGFHRVVCPALVRYEKSFPERLKNNAAFESLKAASELASKP